MLLNNLSGADVLCVCLAAAGRPPQRGEERARDVRDRRVDEGPRGPACAGRAGHRIVRDGAEAFGDASAGRHAGVVVV